MNTSPNNETFSILIAALGGEGGGVLANWITDAIRRAGYYVQGTSIPGVAQRTGATTYYLEICLTPVDQLGGRRPVLGLTPTPGNVDVMIASELVEAARAVQLGMISADRTTMIASSHRIYATSEKMHLGDGRFNTDDALRVVHDNARQAIVFDMQDAADKSGTVINAVLLGALAGSGAVPIDAALFEEALKASGKSVDASLRGYHLGFAPATDEAESGPMDTAPAGVPLPSTIHPDDLPDPVREIARAGFDRCVDFHDADYADLYLQRVHTAHAVDITVGGAEKDWEFSAEIARFLALRMTYEDIMRVADLKTRADRFSEMRQDTMTPDGTPILVTEFFKPGPEEFCALLPVWMGRRIMNFVARNDRQGRFHMGLNIKSHTITGFVMLRVLARLKSRRQSSWRYAEEEALTAKWLDAATRSVQASYQLGVEAARSVDLVKGYGNTYHRGVQNLTMIFDQLLYPALINGRDVADHMRQAREAALQDPDGDALDQVLAAATGSQNSSRAA